MRRRRRRRRRRSHDEDEATRRRSIAHAGHGQLVQNRMRRGRPARARRGAPRRGEAGTRSPFGGDAPSELSTPADRPLV
ncbi:unnamed protein product [Prorocentrum cordatum]|uniref:Uncharacterized protein n=1 Tax=Prorocentrum cordatum TaxID=2364126 RepID=A0ABN9VFZ1_9DINO|nr:unnamed protein product [Polarella glacialis]